MNSPSSSSVPSGTYDDAYFAERCGGGEFFSRFGAEVLKPDLQLAFRWTGGASGLRVLDVGCGRGELLARLAGAGAETHGVDYAEASVRLARRTSPSSDIRLIDAKSLPYPDRFFDAVFLMGIVEHLHPWEWEGLFGEIRRVLKDGGEAVLTTCANRTYFKTMTYSWRRRAAGLLRRLGIPLRPPRPPRSDEDERTHVNEMDCFRMRRGLSRLGWQGEVFILPNKKFLLDDLYDSFPPGFPSRRPSPLLRSLYLGLVFHFPVDIFLGRFLFAVLRPLSASSRAIRRGSLRALRRRLRRQIPCAAS